ncbi:MAG TPA: DUF4097 family beta strand repeat-containing protein [Bryobacteraceae bacterium]|nr:DUF4097 family beta strand repeat-containing protein [Bryobacteraceae bacterium]
MKTISRMLLVASVGFLALASAEELNKSWNVGNNPQLRVEAGDASIEVQGSDTNAVRLKLVTEGISIGPGGVELIEHQANGALDLRIQEHPHTGGWHHRSVHVSLVVPKSLTGVVKTGDGSIRLANLGGKLRADTGDGSIEGTGLNGALDAHSGDGSMHLDGVFNDIRLRTGDGSIHLRAGAGSKVDMGWQLASGDGSISVEIPKDLAADLDLRTGDGHISANVPVTVNDLNNKREIHGRMNGGGAPITIRTGDGSISLGSI